MKYMNELIKHFSSVMIKIPDFIDCKKHMDHMVWMDMMIMSNILLDLVNGKVMTNKTVYTKWLDYQDQWDNVLNSGKLFIVLEYYQELIEYMIELCIENELFEAAANIKKFMKFNNV